MTQSHDGQSGEVSNVEKAAGIIAKANSAYRERHWLSDIVTYQAALEYAHTLADEGLLAADLPEPMIDYYGTPQWPQVFPHFLGSDRAEYMGSVSVYAGAIEMWGEDTHCATPEEARALAYALLAAANHAEGEA